MQGNNLFGLNKDQLEFYSNSYTDLGDIINDIPIIHSMPRRVAQLLPTHFVMVDLGSGDGKDSANIEKETKAMGKEGQFIKVDPYIKQEGIINLGQEQYLSSCSDKQLDLIFCKYALHFVKDLPTFFKNAHRALKNDGKMFIHQMAKDVRLPWSDRIDQLNRQTAVYAQDVIPQQLFEWKIIAEKKEVQMDREMFKKAIKTKTWSHLLLCTQEEIDECLKLFDSKQHSMVATLSKNQFILTKKSMNV